uniref:Uncharacterized protein n=1 Tax=Anguilla anguilla TaxID=7936 RepID=A0A0E9SEM7_ANGAN
MTLSWMPRFTGEKLILR